MSKVFSAELDSRAFARQLVISSRLLSESAVKSTVSVN